MKSPFPGMDPYLEKHWEDVHSRLIGYVADALQPQLPDDLIARIEEKVYVEDEKDREIRKPDVRVVDAPVSWQPSPGESSTAVLDAPVRLEPVGDPIKHRSVLIYDSSGKRIVTAIEILSPWNKARGREVRKYLAKRDKFVDSNTNLVEIDLVRAGNWRRMIGEYSVPEPLRSTYRVTITMPDDEGPLHYAIWLHSKLPTIRVPLRPAEEPIKLNLQELIEKVYVMGRYNRIDYSEPCEPPLKGADATWADAQLKAAGKRV